MIRPRSPLNARIGRFFQAGAGLLVACAASQKSTPVQQTEPDPGSDTGSDTGVMVNPGVWEVGAAESCAAPADVRWSDQSDLFWNGTTQDFPNSDNACVALEGEGDSWRIWWSGVDDGTSASLTRVDLTTLEHSTFAVPHLTQRFVVDDFDNDGLDDVGTLLEGGWLLWGGTTEGVVLDELQVSLAYSPLDLDGDGLDDLVVLGLGELDQDPPAPELVLNLGDRRFGTPVAASTGGVGMGFSSQVLDWDGDGSPDVYQCNDSGAIAGGNQVLLNQGGTLVVGDARGADLVGNCMSASFGDVDRDGKLDLYMAQDGPQALLVNNSSFGFVDVGLTRIPEPWTDGQMGWSSVLVDADNDGREDILVSTSDFVTGDNGVWPLWWLRQQEDDTFVESGAAAGLPLDTSGRGLAVRDINGDGVVDLLLADARRAPYLLLSEGCSAGSWVEVSAPAGSLVTVLAGGELRAALVSRQDGWCGWAPPTVHIGLGQVEIIDRITVTAPWHSTAWIEEVAPRSRLRWSPD